MRNYHTKKIALPGGKYIEVVVFGDDEIAATTAPADHSDGSVAVATAANELHICPECASGLVYPVGWEERRGDSWEITLRCPNCEWWNTDEYHDDEVERFDDVLNDGTEELLASLRKVARANMEDDVERLAAAIRDDLIVPMDF